MKLYVNINKQVVRIADEHGRIITIRPNQRILLPEYFDRYIPSGHLSFVNTNNQMSRKTEDTRNKIGRSKVSEGIRRSHKPNQDVVIDDSQIQPMPNVTPQSRRDRSPRTNDTIQVSRTNMTRIKPARNRELNKSSKNNFMVSLNKIRKIMKYMIKSTLMLKLLVLAIILVLESCLTIDQEV